MTSLPTSDLRLPTFAESCDYLFSLPSWSRDGAYHPGLDRTRRLLESVGNPHTAYPVVHVAGTNGKGSVASMIAAAFSAGDCRVGLHTSPHLFSFAERMRIDGRPAAEDWIAASTARLAPTINEVKPSFFEASTVLALLYFAEEKVDLAVVEVGMGGRLDATNVVEPCLSVITNVGFDHTDQLGKTLPEIAREKAGIVKTRVPVVSGACQSDVRTVIREVCAACDSPLHETCTDGVETLPAGVELDLAGAHQVGNALVAIRGLEILTNTHSELHADIHAGLAKTRQLAGLRARCEVLSESPLIVVDVAHNPEGIRAALRCTRELGAGLDELYVLIAVAADKDVSGILDALADASATIIPVEVENERILRASDLANRARDKGLRILEIDGLEEALEHFSEHLGHNGSLLATGSHYVVGTMPSGMFETRPH